jgi:hypothetical protein
MVFGDADTNGNFLVLRSGEWVELHDDEYGHHFTIEQAKQLIAELEAAIVG